MKKTLDRLGTLLVFAGLVLLCVAVSKLTGCVWWGVLLGAALAVLIGLWCCGIAAGMQDQRRRHGNG